MENESGRDVSSRPDLAAGANGVQEEAKAIVASKSQNSKFFKLTSLVARDIDFSDV